MARLGTQLQVVWTEAGAGGTRTIRTRLLTADGRLASAIRPVVSGWLAMLNDPKVIGPATTRRVVFGGIRSTGSDPYNSGAAVFAQSSNGINWTLRSGSLSHTTAAGSDGDIAAIDARGVPFFAKGGFGGGPIVHRGISATMPASEPDINTTQLGGAPFGVALARDRATNGVSVGWFSLGATDPDEAGTFVQRIWPRPNGALLKAPGSANGAAQAIHPDGPVALAERVGGGLWLAYHVGYPTSNRIRLWRVGTSSFRTINTGQTSSHLCLTPSTNGRLWLSWRTIGDHRLHAVRTNKAVSAFGPVQHITQPGGLSSSVHLTACEGSRGPLSLVVNAQTTGGQPRIYARHILPPLSASRTPARLNTGTVTVVVKDAGDAVAGARVKFRATTYTTNAQGKAFVRVSAAVPARTYTINVTKTGYSATTLSVQVT